MSQSRRSAVSTIAVRIFATAAIMLAAPGAQATLVGVSVNGALAGVQNITVGTQFISPATVDEGPIPEFSGALNDANQVSLDVSVDLFAESFVIDTFVNGQWGTQIGDGFVLSLTDLSWLGSSGAITDVVLTGRNGDTEKWDLEFANLINFGEDWIDIQLMLTQPASGQASFEFGITASHIVVPEPATVTLLFLGLAGTTFRRRAVL